MSAVEFVNQEKAEALGAEFVAFDTASDEARIASWFVLLEIARQVGPTSNVGIAGISWTQRRGRTSCYRLRAICVDGPLATTMHAPETLEAAREPEEVAKAAEMLERKVRELGGRTPTQLPKGTSRAIIEALSMSEPGRAWLAERKQPQDVLLRMVRVADTYGREGVYPRACLGTHATFLPFDDRAELVRAFPGSKQAEMKALSLRGPGVGGRGKSKSKGKAVRTLALMSGAPERTSRAVLDAALDGCSERKLVRLAREAVRMAGELQVSA